MVTLNPSQIGKESLNPTADTRFLSTYAHYHNQWVRKNIAQNPNTPTSTLALLSKDESAYVREATIANPKTPLRAIQEAQHDHNPRVSKAAKTRLQEFLTPQTNTNTPCPACNQPTPA